MKRATFILGIVSLITTLMAFSSMPPTNSIALLKYNGGGDWYANPTSLPNLAEFCNKQLDININTDPPTVEVGSPDIFNYPFIHMTGHGNVVFSAEEAQNLRTYLIAGGFLHVDDNFGMDPYIRPALKKVFPELDLVELPFSHPIFHQRYDFKNGLPKIHEHDNKPPRAFGLFWEGRLVCLYTYECDLGDGWEDADVHKDPEEVRMKALQMGANIIQFVFMDNTSK
ncbi:MAG TPA: DUF4159 domain-containing protein [Chitinophagales bacterium]|nr:DUF4159 domain-containing protein [Chitinophagales bacterium]HRG84302.1 DUF4159 domain-containing protein [Chitinophagales bacterium]HRH52075.1 DUF4159 domain-containing protein [Chitinophagales bacterium]